ncbi:MAG TPA: MobF family relaxase [Pseudobdellovibrionaceae bacterium]|nr:MobF family relaxase [Pseudobdellovibrionaceae bacterium]
MITFKVQKEIEAAKTYFDEHLTSNEYPLDQEAGDSASEYHSEAGRVQGKWVGKIVNRMGLSGKSSVNKEQFENLLQNKHPLNGTQITPRMKAKGERRLFFDATVSAPKSVSIMALTMNDRRLLEAHEKALNIAITEMEKYAQTRVRTHGRNELRRTHEVLGVQFTHTTSRSHDPQLHTHNVIFNVTFDQEENRYKAIECFSMYERSNYITEVYRNELAREVISLGYEIEKVKHGWEIKGVDKSICELFSKRSSDIKETASRMETKLGRKLTNAEYAHISHQTRKAKDKDLTHEKVLQMQRSQLQEVDIKNLNELLNGAIKKEMDLKNDSNKKNIHPSLPKEVYAVEHAVESVFERVSVVKDHALLTKALSSSYGNLNLDNLKFHLNSHKDLIILPEEEKIAHRDHLLIEHSLCDFVLESKGKFDSIPTLKTKINSLRVDQNEVYNGVLNSKDKVTAIRGGAGTGKSYLISKLVETYTENKMPVLAIAPTTGATQNIKNDLKVDAITMQSFLTNSNKHVSDLKNGVLVVDEAGLISIKEMKNLFDISKDQNFRILLIGDTRQHHAVKAGDALRVLERYGEMSSFDLIEITRQKETLYKAAIKDLSQKNLDRAWNTFDQMKVIKELTEASEIRESIAKEYLEKIKEHKSTLIVSPTWEEIKNTTYEVRNTLKREGILIENIAIEKDTFASIGLTETEKKHPQSLIPKDHYITWQKNYSSFKAKTHWNIVEIKNSILTIENKGIIKNIELINIDSRLFDVTEKKKIEITQGEKILIQGNFKDLKSKNNSLINGEILTVEKILADGGFLTQEGKHIKKEFDTFDYGYATTSYGSQGKTCDHVIVSMNIGSGKALSLNQFYVSTSRGRESLSIYVDDKEYMKEKLKNQSTRESVHEFLKIKFTPSLTKRALDKENQLNLQKPWLDRAKEFFIGLKSKAIARNHRERSIDR